MSVTSDLPVALSAYESGVLFGRLLPFVLGAALLVAGLVRRSRSSASAPPSYAGWGAAATPTPPATTGQADVADVVDGVSADPFAAPTSAGAGTEPAAASSGWTAAPAAPKRDGKGLIIAGSILLGLGVLTALGSGLERAQEVAEQEAAESGVAESEVAGSRVERTVALPTELLGLPRDAALSEQAQADANAAGGLPPGGQLAAYTDQQDLILVIAAETQIADLEGEVVGYREGIEPGTGPLGDGTPVDPGPLGGAARCWSTDFEGTPGATCVFVDGGSILSTIDFGTTDVQEAGERGRQARASTVRGE